MMPDGPTQASVTCRECGDPLTASTKNGADDELRLPLHHRTATRFCKGSLDVASRHQDGDA